MLLSPQGGYPMGGSCYVRRGFNRRPPAVSSNAPKCRQNLARGASKLSADTAAHVRLVREPALRRDSAQGELLRQPKRLFHADRSQICADRATVLCSEDSGEVDRMHSCHTC